MLEEHDTYVAPTTYIPGVTAIKPPYKGEVFMTKPTPKMPTKEQKASEESEERAQKLIPPKTRSYKFKYLGTKFRFLKNGLESETAGVKVDRHASNLEAIEKVESKSAEFRVMEIHRRHVDLLIAELSKIEEVVEENNSMLPSEVLKMVTAKKKSKRDLLDNRRKGWRRDKKKKSRRTKDGISNRVSSNSPTTIPAEAGALGAAHQLSQVLEAPSLFESSSSVVEHGSVIKPSGIEHDSFHDIRFLGNEEGPEEEEEEDPGESWNELDRNARIQKAREADQKKRAPHHSDIGTDLALQAYEDRASFPTHFHPKHGHFHMKFSTKRHWYVEGPAVYFNLNAMNERQQKAHQQGTVFVEQAPKSSSILRAKHRNTSRKVRDIHVTTATNKWSLSARQRHLAASLTRDEVAGDSSSEYTSSSEDDEHDEDEPMLDLEEAVGLGSASPSKLILASQMAAGPDEDTVEEGKEGEEFEERNNTGSTRTNRPESENSVNNQANRERSRNFLSAVPQLDAEALQDLKVSLRNVHMYYRNYSGNLEANAAPGVEEEMTRSPRDWDWFETQSGSNSRPGTTNTDNRGASRGRSRGQSRGKSRDSHSRDSGKAQDDSAIASALGEGKGKPDTEQQSKSAPVTARGEGDDDDDATAPEGEKTGGNQEESSQRDIALTLSRLRQAKEHPTSTEDRAGPVVANSNFFLQKQGDGGQIDGDKESGGSPTDLSWMVRSEKQSEERKVLVPQRPEHGPPSRPGTGNTSRSTSSGGTRPESRARKMKPAAAPEPEYKHPPPESPVRRVRTPQLMKEIIDEESRKQRSHSPLDRGRTNALMGRRGDQNDKANAPRDSQVSSIRVIQRAGNTRSKAFVSHAQEVHSELKDLPIFKDFADYSLNSGQRKPLMADHGRA